MKKLHAPVTQHSGGRHLSALVRPKWRAILGLAVSAVLLVPILASPVAEAQGRSNWWEQIPGFGGTPGGTYAPRPRPPSRYSKPEELKDLRADSTPLRSEVILEAMDGAIDWYQRIVQSGGWPRIPGTRTMFTGEEDERVPAVRRRLMITGDLRRDSGWSSYTFDDELERAVRQYQERNGLRITGRVDRAVIASMNVSAMARLQQLRLNRKRISDLIATARENRYVMVNVPAFELEAVEGGVVQQRHRVIVGRTERQTPGLVAQIKALNFFPYWRVPDSVAINDLIPRAMKEPDYLAKEQIRVMNGYNGPEISTAQIDWRQVDATKIKFRQDPGPQNALGLVRIDMPNEHAVYMHDTPMKHLFNQRGRAFSAGCVRVQDVFDLVAWIAQQEPGWDRARIDEVLATGIGQDIQLARPIPVYFAYVTAWADPKGRVDFRPDIYGRDGDGEFASGIDNETGAPKQALAP